MRTLWTFALVAACSAPPKKTNTDEGTNVPATCCCKTTPLTSEDAKPVYSRGVNRMECSTQQGTCVDDVQCNGSRTPPPSTSGGDTPPPPPLEPSSSTLP